MSRARRVHLRQADTWTIWETARPDTLTWATVESDTEPGGTVAWSVELTEDATGERFTFGHDALITTLCRFVDERATVTSRTMDRFRDMVDAVDHEYAADALVDLGSHEADVLVQLATVGEVRHI